MRKLVCISGCSKGLGRAMAIEFHKRGWKVAGGARNEEALEILSRLWRRTKCEALVSFSGELCLR